MIEVVNSTNLIYFKNFKYHNVPPSTKIIKKKSPPWNKSKFKRKDVWGEKPAYPGLSLAIYYCNTNLVWYCVSTVTREASAIIPLLW
jgi:hypothetical protein